MSMLHFPALIAASLSVLIALNAALAQTAPPSPSCTAPQEFSRLGEPLRRTALAIASGDPVVIVAVGSSSTSGAGASSPTKTYPARLEVELRERLPGAQITVLNRGVGGEVAEQMLRRFTDEVIKEQPDLVLWQVGTNSVLRDRAITGAAPLLREGIRRLKASFADIVLIDSQYAPKVLAKPNAPGMIELLARTAKEEGTGLFQRFAIMRHWVEHERMPFDRLLSPDGLHMNDFSYGCVAKLLADAITDAVRPPIVARAKPTR